MATVALNELDQWLSEQEENTVDTPYEIEIQGLTTENFVEIKTILQNNETKYVSLRNTHLPEGITSLEESFRKCYSLVYPPYIPNSVTNMSGTFRQCINLVHGRLSNNVTNMNRTFYQCSSLITNDGIPEKVTDATSAYARCPLINSVHISEGVASLNYTFENCTSLKDITIPSTVRDLNNTFEGCTNLDFIYFAGDFQINVYYRAFYGCNKLKSFRVDSLEHINTLKNFLDTIHDASVYNFSYTSDECNYTISEYGFDFTETNVNNFEEIINDLRLFFRDGVTKVKINGINDLDDLEVITTVIKEVLIYRHILDLRPTVLPSGITSLEEAFMGCEYIKYAPEIPTTVTDITRAYKNDSPYLEENPVIPSSVIKLTEAFSDAHIKSFKLQDASQINNWTDYTDIFANCNHLTKFYTDTPYELKQFLLEGNTGLPTDSSGWEFYPFSDSVYVHIDNLNNFTRTLKANTATTPYKIIVTGLNSVSDANKIRQRLNGKYVDLSETVLPTFSGNQFENLWSGCSTLVKAPAVPNGITSIKNSFYDCSSLKEVPLIPEGVTSLWGAFENCSALEESPILPQSVTDMPSTFKGCTSLRVPPEIPSGVTNMEECFSGCTSLQSAPEIPSGVTNMSQTFYYCEVMENAPQIPESVINMNGCFRNCYEIKIVPNIPKNVTDMGLCFRGCTALEEITKFDIPISALEDINNDFQNCFSSCPNLTKIGIRSIKEEKDGDKKEWHIVNLEVGFTSIGGKAYDREGNAVVIPQTTIDKGNIVLPFITDELLFTDSLLSLQIEEIIEKIILYKYGYFNDKVIPANEKSFVLWADDKRHVVTNLDMGGGTDIEVYPSEQAIIDDLPNLEVGDIVASDDPNENETIAILMAKIQELEEKVEADDTYSTTEVKTNKKWIDGKPIYRRCVVNADYHTVDVSSWNIDTPIKCYGVGKYLGENKYYNVPAGGTTAEIHLRTLSKTTIGYTNTFSYGWTDETIVCEYTKTTDV